MSRIFICAALMMVATASAQIVFGSTSFCERYAAALFPTQDAATAQASLITAVLTRALNGNSTVTPAVTGILNSPLQMPFFNGTRGVSTNFYTDAAARTALVTKLVQFFEGAMKCRAITGLPTPANMKSVHQGLNIIDKPIWDDFVANVANTLVSFGVPNDSTATGDISYANALFGQFNKGSTQQICSGPNCLAFTDFKEFTTGTNAGNNAWLADDQTSSVSIAVNGYIHWNIGSIHNVVQSDSTWTTAIDSGFTSGAVGATRTYTRQFPTAGTYYFYCNPHKATMRGTIVVGSSPSAASGFSVSVLAVLVSIVASVAAFRRF